MLRLAHASRWPLVVAPSPRAQKCGAQPSSDPIACEASFEFAIVLNAKPRDFLVRDLPRDDTRGQHRTPETIPELSLLDRVGKTRHK
jgi:hypothetical protein